LKYKNRSTGIASTAGKFSSAFALGSRLLYVVDSAYARKIYHKAVAALALGRSRPGVCQTAPGGAPYFYEEDNWSDDMELACASLESADSYLEGNSFLSIRQENKKQSDSAYIAWAKQYAQMEPVTPWLGKDTARHYQWYPFINPGHFELAKILSGAARDMLISYYRDGIQRVWEKAQKNAFFRGIPFIWCSNNLTVAFAIQCYWYRQLSHDNSYRQLEQACVDWIFGCNPWGTSMVYGLPSWGDFPDDPHSSFTHLYNYPIYGGMVDGPVYNSIYSHLYGVELHKPDAYAPFQSELAVYHDDYGDYSTNEPTMDGTATLIYLLAAKQDESRSKPDLSRQTNDYGAIIRGDSTQKAIALVFTGDEFGEGLNVIGKTLRNENVKASFFFTGRFYSNPSFRSSILQLAKDGNYLGPHSDQHLLYCDWKKRDSLLISRDAFEKDMRANLAKMKAFGIDSTSVNYFIPPYEWWNDSIAVWSAGMGMKLMNFTPGTRSNADYTFPGMKNYLTSNEIWQSVVKAKTNPFYGYNGYILLIHAGTDPKRKDKFYFLLPQLIRYFKSQGYRLERVDELLGP